MPASTASLLGLSAHAMPCGRCSWGLLEPIEQMRALELARDFTARLALLEELKGMPFGAIWDYHCLQQNVPVGTAFLEEVRSYEKQTLAQRG